MPTHRYRVYDEMRMTLADEAIVRVDDAMSLTIPKTLERTSKGEIKLLSLLVERDGPINYSVIKDKLPNTYKSAIRRTKSHQLIVLNRKKKTSRYDITDYGRDLLKAHRHQKAELDREP